MKTLILSLGALTLAATAAHADEIVTKETTAGVHSAPVAGATPQARENPAPDTVLLEKRTKTTVESVPSRTVVESGGSADVEVRTRMRD